MQRIDTRYATEDNRFTTGVPSTGTRATEVSATWCNSVQEELVNVVLGAGMSLAQSNEAQVLQAVRMGGRSALKAWVPGGSFVPDESLANYDLTDNGGFSTKALNATPIGRWPAPWITGTLVDLTYHYRVAVLEGGMEIKVLVINLSSGAQTVLDTWTLLPSSTGYYTKQVSLNRILLAGERVVVRALLNGGTSHPAPIELLGMDVQYTPPTD